MIRVKLPLLDRFAHALERRALQSLDARGHRPGRSNDDAWRDPMKLWPDFGED